jgi:hypothetical protein
VDNIVVYFVDDSELTEMESIHKGYRSDIYTNIGGKYFKLVAYDIARLKQDFESCLNENGYFDIEPNLILVREVSRKEIVLTIEKLNDDSFFDGIKAIDSDSISILDNGEVIINHSFWGDRKLIKAN